MIKWSIRSVLCLYYCTSTKVKTCFSCNNFWLISNSHDLCWICCLTCDRIQNRIWTWTLLRLKIKHPFHLMVNSPLSNHHFQNAHLTNLTFIDIYEIPMYFEWNLGWKCENLISKWSPPPNLNYFNESHSSPVDPGVRPTTYPFCLGILKLCNFCNHYTIFDYGKTQRRSRDRLRTGELEWFQILGETMGSCLTSWRFLPSWIIHNSLMSNKINNAICIRIMTFTVLSLLIVLKWISTLMTHMICVPWNFSEKKIITQAAK